MDEPAKLDVVVVGGAGSMGRFTVRYLARLGTAKRLVIADLDLSRAQMLAAEVGEPCEALRLDATDEQELRSAFADCDAVVNTLGPFSLLGPAILTAALECGVDYVDIDDDWESTLDALALDAEARRRGCCVIKGIGGSPGTSNLCAMSAAARLDAVEELITGWSLGGAVVEEEAAYQTAAGPTAAVEHWLLQSSGTIRVWDDGAEQEVRPLERLSLDIPGLGTNDVYTVGHPEAVTLPRAVPGLRRAINVMSGPAWIFDHLRAVAADYDAGRIDLREGAMRAADAPRPVIRGPRDPLPSCWALARGRRGDERLAVVVFPKAFPPGRMGGGTGSSAAIGLELLRRGRGGEPGVHFPETVLDPGDFFALYAELAGVSPPTAAALLAIDEAPWTT